jgi:hypothetical protein
MTAIFRHLQAAYVCGAKLGGSRDSWASPTGRVRFAWGMSPIVELFGLSRAEMEALVVQSRGEMAGPKRVIAAQHDGTARLKGAKGRPSIKPSGMENGTEAEPTGNCPRRRGHRKVTQQVVPATEVMRVSASAGSQFKGHEPCLMQDLLLSARAMRYRREGWLSSLDETVLVPQFGNEVERRQGRPGVALMSDRWRRAMRFATRHRCRGLRPAPHRPWCVT